MRKVIFDVGARDGTSFCEAARQGHIVYAFEPTPSFAAEIKNWCDADDLKTFHFVQAAVSVESGEAKFNISANGDGGCSSLKEYVDNINDVWSGRNDFVVTETISVRVLRMDSFLQENSIDKIDYLHIDTQGSDLDVLKSFGKEISRVVEGVMEVPNTITLYKGVPTKEESIAWLMNNNFQIVCVENDSSAGEEQNVYFRNKAYGEVDSPWVKSGTSQFRYS